MSRYFPHPSYAEDQPLAHTILTTHVATRAVTLGTLIGVATTGARTVIPGLRPKTPTTGGSSSSSLPPAFATRLLRSCANSIVVTLGVTGVGLVARMWGRDLVEWQDRSWRLLENKGQLETDDWTYGGMGGAAVAAAVASARAVRRRGVEGGGGRQPAVAVLGWRGLLGAAGLGGAAGMFGYLGWRYGVNGGKFPDTLAKKEERTGL